MSILLNPADKVAAAFRGLRPAATVCGGPPGQEGILGAVGLIEEFAVERA